MPWLELLWIGPPVVIGAVGWAGIRRYRGRERRLAYDASREALRIAKRDAVSARAAVRTARAEVARATADRAAGHGRSSDVAAARRELDAALLEARAAAAVVRVRQASVSADRAALAAPTRTPADLPLARVIAADDAVTARWMAYETDPARVIAFPAMADARVPQVAAFLDQLRETRSLRRAASAAKVTPAEFGAYRDAVARLVRAFDAAEAEAWRRARASGTAPAGPGPDSPQPGAWMTAAQEIAQNFTQNVLVRAAEALARATAPAPRSGDRDDRDDAR